MTSKLLSFAQVAFAIGLTFLIFASLLLPDTSIRMTGGALAKIFGG